MFRPNFKFLVEVIYCDTKKTHRGHRYGDKGDIVKMKLSTVTLLCAVAYACGVLVCAQEECETEAFNNLPEVCMNESFVPAGTRNNTLLYQLSNTLAC